MIIFPKTIDNIKKRNLKVWLKYITYYSSTKVIFITIFNISFYLIKVRIRKVRTRVSKLNTIEYCVITFFSSEIFPRNTQKFSSARFRIYGWYATRIKFKMAVSRIKFRKTQQK